MNTSKPFIEHRRAPRRLLQGILIGLTSVSAALAQTSYAITDLGVLPGLVTSQAAGINDRGDIVGASMDAGNSMTGFVIRAGVMTSIGKLPSGDYSRALGVNSAGNVVGGGDTNLPSSQALLFRNNQLINIGTSNSTNAYAFYMNDAGVIAGDMTQGRNSGYLPVIWVEDPSKPGRFRSTFLSPVPGDTYAFAIAANQSMQIVGYSQNTAAHGVLWNNDARHTPVLLAPAPGDSTAEAYGINDLGVAVGHSWNGIAHSSPVVWSADASHTLTVLPALPGDIDAMAIGINNSGQVIGYSGLDAARQGVTPATWINGQIHTLQSMLDASGTGWVLTSVTGINNMGFIVGAGSHNGVQRAFLLSPNL